MQIKHNYTHFGIAWRFKGNEKWNIVKDPHYGWTADPFLVKYKEKIFLFAEVFLYKSERNGKIAYCVFDGNCFGEWNITMDCHWHISYPNVFIEKDRLLMCPETWQLGEVALYELIELPNKWRKVKTLLFNSEYCDSTFFDYNNQKWMFTYRRASEEGKEAGILCKCDENFNVLGKLEFSTTIGNCRCGGKVIYEGEKRIRVAQNGIPYYGKELIFYEIDSVWPNYREHEIKRISSKDIVINGFERQTGVHTYNCIEDIEVIDFRYQSYRFKDIFDENIAISHTHKVFLNKYRG